MGRATIEVDDSQLRTLADQARQQLDPVLNTLDQLKEAARNVPVVVASDETAPVGASTPIAVPDEPNTRLTTEATIESGELPDPVRLQTMEGHHVWLYPNEDGKTVRIETEAGT